MMNIKDLADSLLQKQSELSLAVSRKVDEFLSIVIKLSGVENYFLFDA